MRSYLKGASRSPLRPTVADDGPRTTDQTTLRNIRLTLAYDGTDFHGWQRQTRAPTLQACLEEALGELTGTRVQLWGSGRTDAGVHALNQVANFKTRSPIPCRNLVRALNGLLPPSVRAKDAREVPEAFHARYDARSKTYPYRILQAPVCSPFLWRFVWHHPYPLDRERMTEAARFLEGTHDFTSFAGADADPPTSRETTASEPRTPNLVACGEAAAEPRTPSPESRSMVRTIFSSRLLWRPHASLAIYEVRGSGFLHHMVRNIVGTLMEVGRRKREPRDIIRVLEACDRTKAGPTAPPQGLCLVRVEY